MLSPTALSFTGVLDRPQTSDTSDHALVLDLCRADRFLESALAEVDFDRPCAWTLLDTSQLIDNFEFGCRA